MFNDLFIYDSDTGKLLWKSKRSRGCVEGREAGTIKSDGRYRTVFVNGKRLYVHRIIWEMHYEKIIDRRCIDHIDRNGLNNFIVNLRLVSLSVNQCNRKISKNNKTKISGVNNHAGGFSVYCAGKYISFTKDFFNACCIRKSEELKNNYLINNRMN